MNLSRSTESYTGHGNDRLRVHALYPDKPRPSLVFRLLVCKIDHESMLRVSGGRDRVSPSGDRVTTTSHLLVISSYEAELIPDRVRPLTRGDKSLFVPPQRQCCLLSR